MTERTGFPAPVTPTPLGGRDWRGHGGGPGGGSGGLGGRGHAGDSGGRAGRHRGHGQLVQPGVGGTAPGTGVADVRFLSGGAVQPPG